MTDEDENISDSDFGEDEDPDKIEVPDEANPTPSSLVCSCHFINGDKTRLPTLVKLNENKLFLYQSPERKKRWW
ncbi:unnamed protein product [Callosobruchus maculatus]|uniref:THAP-type domain-containing protein n=1 Tax=Callosobruchus maculatus TaxID=64391 RepID=A0A653BZH8_CALMS|nr:unnamed protein product [Callosobruchus maculatus]